MLYNMLYFTRKGCKMLKRKQVVVFTNAFIRNADHGWQVVIDRYGKRWEFISRTIVSNLDFKTAVEIRDAQ